MARRYDTRDSFVPEALGTEERLSTVGFYFCRLDKKLIPWIKLSGMWLEGSGFTPFSAIRVRVMTDCLVITRE
jgi:hypothetical protein